VSAPWLAAVLHPLLQMAVMAPALLLAAPKEVCPRRLRLEWAAVLLASLAISTSPASYLFTLLILPVCLVWEALQRREDGLLLAALLFLYLAAGFPGWTTAGGTGWLALLAVPRLYALILAFLLTCTLLLRQQPGEAPACRRRTWAVGLSVILILSIAVGLRHQQGLYEDYQWRLAGPGEIPEILGSLHQTSKIVR